ncbi:MAG: hypothetical protein M2R46_04484 [Verrucomicrobia subdivision 3 bacterium]|nr:hypothetical protein [Limisphaerales bacterium]
MGCGLSVAMRVRSVCWARIIRFAHDLDGFIAGHGLPGFNGRLELELIDLLLTMFDVLDLNLHRSNRIHVFA